MLVKNNILTWKIMLIIWGLLSNQATAAINAEIFTTAKNMEIILLADQTTDLISLAIGFKGAGAIADVATKAGLGATMMELIFRSNAAGMDRHVKARKIRELGILSGINYDVNDDDIKIEFKCPKENLAQALALLQTILFTAELTNIELNKLKNFGIGNANLENASELDFAWTALRANIYKGHPYANAAVGNHQGLQTLNLEDIQQAIKQRLAKDNLIVAVVGDIDKATISQLIDTTFATLAEHANLPKIAYPLANIAGEVRKIFKDSPQSTTIFVQPSISYQDKNFYPLLILNKILGGEPFTSRLWLEIREKLGLVYSISTSLHAKPKFADIMLGWFKCNNEDLEQVIAVIKQQWVKLKNYGVSQEEFEHAKTGIIGQYALNFVSPEQTTAYLLENRLLGFDINHINEHNAKIKAITIDEVNAVAKTLIQPDKLSFLVIGNS